MYAIRSYYGSNADVHATQRIDLVVLDFREDDLLFDTHVVVALTIETLASHAAEVANTGQGNGHQTIQEFVV